MIVKQREHDERHDDEEGAANRKPTGTAQLEHDKAIERHRHEIEACSSIIGNAVGNLRVAEEKEVLHILHQDDEHQDADEFFQPRAWLANEYPRHHQVEHQTHAIDEEKQLHLAHR